MPSVQLVYSVTMLMCTAIKVWVSLGRICESPYFPVNYATPTWSWGRFTLQTFDTSVLSVLSQTVVNIGTTLAI